MSRSRRSSVQRYHDRVAAIYDPSYGDDFWKWHDDLTWDYLKPFLPKNQRAEIVDLGCGTGKWGAKLVKSGFFVTSVDISVRMLEQARAKIDAIRGTTKTEFVQADLCDLGVLPAAHFSLALALGDCIGCARDPARALREIRRLLTPGGVLLASFDNRLAAVDYYLEKGDAEELKRFLRDGKTHWLTKNAAERFEIVTFTRTGVQVLMEANGFEVLELVGKTVLPMRHYRHLLASHDERRKWARIEKRLARDPSALTRASHFQVACRVGASHE